MGAVNVIVIPTDNSAGIDQDRDFGVTVNAAIQAGDQDDYYPVDLGHCVELVAADVPGNSIAVVVVEGGTGYWLERQLENADGELPDWSGAEQHLVELVRRLGYTVIKHKK